MVQMTRDAKAGAACLTLLLMIGCSTADGTDDISAGDAAGDGDKQGTTDPTGSGGNRMGASGASGDGDGAAAGTDAGDSQVGAGGASADTDGASADAGAAGEQQCDDGSAFSGPQLRDCDLPGACGRCLWEKACASFLFRCARDADCVCMAECVGTSGVRGVQACLGQCDLTESPPGFDEWVRGAADMCWDEGCGTLDDPPPAASGSSSGGSTGAGTEPDCAFDENLTHDPCGPVLQLESADGSLCARIERRNDGPGSDANTSWTLLDVRIGPLGQVCHAEAAEDLCWFSSHHNYAEWLHVSCGDLHYDLNIGKGCGKLRNPDSSFRLHVFENGPGGNESCAPTADGKCSVVPPMELFPR